VIKDIYGDMPDGWDESKRDNKIVMCALQCGAKIISNDINVRLKAECVGVKSQGWYPKLDEQYKGWREINLSDDEVSDFYSDSLVLPEEPNINEYLLIKHKSEIIDKCKYTKDGFKHLAKKKLKSIMFGDLKAKDIYQELAIDSLLSDQITVITGLAGSGKSILSLMYAMWAIQNGKYDRIVVMFNPVPLRGASTLGFYKGDMLDKAMSGGIGHVLTTKFGDRSEVDLLIAQGKIKLVPMSDCRGMEIRDNEILYITEAQNTNIDLMKICLSRVSKGAKVIIEGDAQSQVDHSSYTGKNNGLISLINTFKGEDLFSCTQLMKVQRSRIAEIADKM
jgi:PhoH-like ATPase